MKLLPAIAIILVNACVLAAPSAQAADPASGRVIYKNYCEGCHGSGGKPVMPGAPDFTRQEGLLQSDLTLFETIQNGKVVMPGFRGTLRDDEILDVISYIRTFL